MLALIPIIIIVAARIKFPILYNIRINLKFHFSNVCFINSHVPIYIKIYLNKISDCFDLVRKFRVLHEYEWTLKLRRAVLQPVRLL